MTTEELDKRRKIERFVAPKPRVGLTEFARSKTWRKELAKNDILEIADRTETAGYLVSPEGMESLLDTIASLEKELEAVQVDSLFATRKDMSDWASGEELASRAKASLKSRDKQVRELLDGDQ